jgi:diacylglycerol kinase family enzyme
MRVLAVINPASGQADAGLYEFTKALGMGGAEVTLRFLTGGKTVRDLVCDASEFDRVVAAGGDGTVSSICYNLRDTEIPILVYPAGTANLIALNLGMPLNPQDLAGITMGHRISRFDLGEYIIGEPGDPARRVQGFAVAAGAGFDAKIMEGAADLKPTIGVAAYLLAALQNLAPTVSRFTLTLDGETVETEGIAVLIVNFARLQLDLTLTHSSDPADGIFEVVVLRTRNAVELLPAVWAAIIDRTTGSHPGRSAGLEIRSAREISVQADPALPFQYDGETTSLTTPFSVKVLPGAANLLVPEAYGR